MKPADEAGRLLVVDDNEMNRDMLARRLRRLGHCVEAVDSGDAALEKVREERWDVVLLDIMMPGVDGLAVLRQLRESHSRTELPVIMVTAKGQSEDIVEALNLGANDYVTKPLDFPVVMARVRTQLQIKRLSDLKDQFLAIASHDLKNPLTAVLNGAKVLRQVVPVGATMTERPSRLLENIHSGARSMQRIIEDFLDFQALEAGQIDLNPAAVDLNGVSARVIDQVEEYARGKGIEMRFAPGENLPRVAADETRIEQLCMNLVGNAVKFSPSETTVTIETRTEDSMVVFAVSDEGPGLTDADLGKLFQKYGRLSNKPTGGEKSSGLGLAICKQLVELQGGMIGARNNGGRGATFWFALPRA